MVPLSLARLSTDGWSSVVRTDGYAGRPEDARRRGLGLIEPQGASARTQRMEHCFGQRLSLLDQLGGFRPGDWQERPGLRVVAVLPVDRLSEDRDEALGAAGAGEEHDVEVRLIDQFSHLSERAARRPCGVRGSRPATVAAEVLPRSVVSHHVCLRPRGILGKRLPNENSTQFLGISREIPRFCV